MVDTKATLFCWCYNTFLSFSLSFFCRTDYKEIIKFVKPAPIDEPLSKKQQKQLAGMKKDGGPTTDS